MELLRYLHDGSFLAAILRDVHFLLLIGLTVASIAVLSQGADWMIDGAVSLARKTGIPKIIIGATIISLGTTTPEAFVSVLAAWMGDPGLALGNAVGSIIADTGFIFGLTCVLAVTPADRFILNRTGWVQVGTATLLVAIAIVAFFTAPAKPVLQRWVGVLFVLMLIGYMVVSVYWARKRGVITETEMSGPDIEPMSLSKSWMLIVTGLALVIAGARILIPCATESAFRLGVPHDVIAATMVALGTSLPELMTAVSSVRKGHPEITVGNIVGADVLNCLFVIGVSLVASPLAVPRTFFTFHFPAMLLILYSFRFFIHMNRDGIFKRWQGAWLLLIYVIYVVLQYALNLGTETGH